MSQLKNTRDIEIAQEKLFSKKLFCYYFIRLFHNTLFLLSAENKRKFLIRYCNNNNSNIMKSPSRQQP